MLDNIKDRVKLLADYLDIKESEIQVKEWGYEDWSTEFRTPEGTFWVLNEDEGKKATYADIDNCMDDLGLDAFTPEFVEWILSNAVDDDWFEDYCREDYEGYASDIADEPDRVSGTYENRLIQECVDAGVIKEEEIDENGRYIGKDDPEELLVDYLVEDVANNYSSYGEWFIQEFGKSEMRELVKNGSISFDMDAIVDECIDVDGIAHFISRYDGREIDLGDGYYAYKQSDYDEREEADEEDE